MRNETRNGNKELTCPRCKTKKKLKPCHPQNKIKCFVCDYTNQIKVWIKLKGNQ